MNIASVSLGMLVSMSALLMSSCVAPPKSVLRQEGPTMEQVLRDAQSRGTSDSMPANASQGHFSVAQGGHYEGWTRDASNETQQRFPVHMNPRLTYYVAPKLVKDRTLDTYLPVPGYTTSYDLYSTTQYALPNELPGSRIPVASPYPDSRKGEDDTVFDGEVKR